LQYIYKKAKKKLYTVLHIDISLLHQTNKNHITFMFGIEFPKVLFTGCKKIIEKVKNMNESMKLMLSFNYKFS